jgi:hypothetical protein
MAKKTRKSNGKLKGGRKISEVATPRLAANHNEILLRA